MRINGVKKDEIDEFVNAVAGKHLSTRDIDLLANAYFRGPEEFREQIKNGNILWGLKRLKQSFRAGGDCTERERQMLKALVWFRDVHKFISFYRVRGRAMLRY
jgi:hypothetical protein